MNSKSSTASTPRTVWITRHGHRYDFEHPEWFETAPRRYDPHLSQRGIQQAKELAQRLKEEAIAHIFSSPFRRCVETAHHVAEVLDLPVKLEWGIGEWLNPEWMTHFPETAPPWELKADFPRLDEGYTSRRRPNYPEAAETTCWQRSGAAATQIAAAFPGNLLFVGHGATVAGMTQGFLGEPPQVRPACCGLVKLVSDSSQAQDWRLLLDGDTSHLSETESTIRLN